MRARRLEAREELTGPQLARFAHSFVPTCGFSMAMGARWGGKSVREGGAGSLLPSLEWLVSWGWGWCECCTPPLPLD